MAMYYGRPSQVSRDTEALREPLIATEPAPWSTQILQEEGARVIQETSTESHPAPTIASVMSQKRKKRPRKLDSEKCAQCRRDKCSPQPRFWPQKCERCRSKGFDCSEGEVKRRARRKASPNSPIASASGPTRQDDQVSTVLGEVDQGFVEPLVENAQQLWDCTDLTNLVAFVQLLNHERSFLSEANSYIKNLHVEVSVWGFGDNPYQTQRIVDWTLPKLTREFRHILRRRQHSEVLTMTDLILYENAHETVDRDFIVPRHEPISDESLAKLPLGVQIRFLIRKLRLDIERCGSCDFNSLDTLIRQLSGYVLGMRPAWVAHFQLSYFDDVWNCDFLPALKSAAYVLVVSPQFLPEPLIRLWIRNFILRSMDEAVPFPIAKFAEAWNSDSDSFDMSTLADGGGGHFRELSLLLVAVFCNKPRAIRTLAKDTLKSDSQLFFDGFGAFHFAASIGSVDCYRELLRCEIGKATEGERGHAENLPLHIAARNGHKHMVEYILSRYSDDENYINSENESYETPLILAAKSGSHDLVQFLLNYPGVNPMAFASDQETALEHAHKDEDLFHLILSKISGQNFNTPFQYGQTLLHSLVWYAGRKAIHSVLSLPSILPDKEDDDGHTPLCFAVQSGNFEAVKALVIRQDVDAMKLSACAPKYTHPTYDSYIHFAKGYAQICNKWSQILDWLKTHCKELEADLLDWEIRNEGEGAAQDAGGFENSR